MLRVSSLVLLAILVSTHVAGPSNAQDLPAGHPPIGETAQASGAKSDDGAKDQKEKKDDEARLPPSVRSEHSATVAGETLNYSAEAGSLVLPAEGNRPAADIFYVSYGREPENAKRPITFVFNGGPGAAAAYLHIGGLGPRVLATSDMGAIEGPPPRLIDNDSTWIDMTDLVFVDPVGTGYSRTAEGKDEEKFWGVEEDIDALADFVRLYLIKHSRTLSPVFLAGESYGGFRVAALARELQKSGTTSPSGIMLISPVLEFALLYGDEYNPLSWALDLPSLAAVKLESDGIVERDALRQKLSEVERYALSDFLVALASGTESGGRTASSKVAELTGLSPDYVERRNARVPSSLFIKEFARKTGRVLSRYDGSITGPDPKPSSTWATGPDPVLDATVPLWTSAFVQYAREELGYKTDLSYTLLNKSTRQKWDFGTSPTRQGYAGVVEELQEARAANPSMPVLIAGGYTDLITPYLASSFLVSQLPTLPNAAPIRVENYAGGHMLYLRPKSRAALKEDVKGMYERAAKAAS